MRRPILAPTRLCRRAGARLLLALVVAGVLLACALPAAARSEATPAAQLSLRDLGNLVCSGFAPYCAEVWRSAAVAEAPFQARVAETCLHVRYRASEDAGIACVLAALRSAPRLVTSSFLQGQFAPGERGANPHWHSRSDRAWRDTAAAYLQRIPLYCDHATPVIFNYFPCLLREVRWFHVVLKRHGIR